MIRRYWFFLTVYSGKLQFAMNFVHHTRHRGFFIIIMNSGQPSSLNPFQQLNHFILFRYCSNTLVRWSRQVALNFEPILFFDFTDYLENLLYWHASTLDQRPNARHPWHFNYAILFVWLLICIETIVDISKLFVFRCDLLKFVKILHNRINIQ